MASILRPQAIFTISVLFLFGPSRTFAQIKLSPEAVRWNAQYTQIFSDNIETIAPVLRPVFSLGPAGSLTSNPAEVIAGNESIKGLYSGSASNSLFLWTNPSVLP